MENLKNLLLLLGVVVFFASCNKEKALLSGTITDAAGAGIEGVTITLFTADGTESGTTTTASDGTYDIETIRGYAVQFVKTGYLTDESKVEDKSKSTIDVILTDDNFNTQYFDNGENTVTDPMFATNSIQPTETNFGNFATGLDAFFTTTTFKGAVNPTGTAWYDGWSFYSRLVAGTTTSAALATRPTKTITDAMLNSSSDTTYWTNDTTYVLEGFVFVSSTKVLDIEEGTIIQGKT